MTAATLDILYEDNHCVVVCKPAGTLTMGDHTGDLSMVDHVREYLRVRYQKPGNVFVGVVHRLDRPVSGVLLLARTSKAASRLSESFRLSSVRKIYVAAVHGRPPTAAGTLQDWLLKDRQTNHVRSVSAGVAGAKLSELKYQLLDQHGDRSLLQIEPVTGRSHQIRVQLATQGLPIVGDRRYGRSQPGQTRSGPVRQIALHAAELQFPHPTRQETIMVKADLPRSPLFRMQ